MNKNLISLLIIFFTTILSANVCWDNGIPLYEGNFIYSTHSTKTDANYLFITWVEFDQGIRKLKLQKTNYEGVPIWQNPVTIDESEGFIIETNIIKSTDECCFINVYYENRSGRKLYKINSSGSVLWENEYEGNYYDDILALENGGIIHLRVVSEESVLYLCGSYYDDQGVAIWDDLNLLELPIQSSNYEILVKEFIDNQLFVLISISESIFFMKFDNTGELLFLSEPFSVTNSIYGKFMNNNFYVLFNDYNSSELKMWYFDLDGNSLSGDDPTIITDFGNSYYANFLNGETYFYCLGEEYEGTISLLKCDYEGNVLSEDTINTLNSAFIQAYDQEQNFISVWGYTNNEYHNYLMKIDDSGASDPIYYLPEYLTTAWFNNMYYIEDGFSMSGIIHGELKTISTLRKQDATTEINTIREIEYDIIDPILIKRPEGVAAYWYSYARNSIMIQQFNEAGEPQYEANGSVLIDNEKDFIITDNVIYSYKVNYSNGIEDTVSISAFNLSGEPLWNSAEQFTITHEYHCNTGISPFLNGHLFYTVTNVESWLDRIIEINYFNENGLIWDEPVVLDVGYVNTYFGIKVKGNNLFYLNENVVSWIKIYEDGFFEEEIILADNSDLMQIVGDKDNYFLLTRDGLTGNREFHYFQNSNLFWEEPWTVYIGDYNCLKPIFEEDTFYLTGYNSPNLYNIHNFDYEHNFLEENSFSYTSFNPRFQTTYVYKKSSKFIFFITSRIENYEYQISYTILDENGNILIPEFAETVIDRSHMESIRDVEFVDENAYLLLSCGYKPMEGEYERNFYLQKIDLSDYVGIINEEIIEPNQTYSIKAFPNPFNPSSKISFSIPVESEIKLTVFNIKGQKVKTLADNFFEIGNHSVVWYGNDESDKLVSSGVYLYELRVNGKSKLVKKCLLLK